MDGLHARSEVFLREDVEAILAAIEEVMVLGNAQVPPVQVINAVRRAFHIEQTPHYRIADVTVTLPTDASKKW